MPRSSTKQDKPKKKSKSDLIEKAYRVLNAEVYLAKKNGASLRLLRNLTGQSYRALYQHACNGGFKGLVGKGRPKGEEVKFVEEYYEPELLDAIKESEISLRQWAHFYGHDIRDYAEKRNPVRYKEFLERLKHDFPEVFGLPRDEYQLSNVRPTFEERIIWTRRKKNLLAFCYPAFGEWEELKVEDTISGRSRLYPVAYKIFYPLLRAHRLMEYNRHNGGVQGILDAVRFVPTVPPPVESTPRKEVSDKEVLDPFRRTKELRRALDLLDQEELSVHTNPLYNGDAERIEERYSQINLERQQIKNQLEECSAP